MARLSVARRISYDVLTEVLSEQKDPGSVLSAIFEQRGAALKRVDRNLAYEIVYGSLRTWHKLYWIVQNYASRDLDSCSITVRVALVCGSYQIYYLDRVPDRASVNESVEYVRARDEKNAVPFVNGILRQVAQRSRYFKKPDPEVNPVAFLALQFSSPEWMVKRWLDRFGFKKLEEMLRTSNKRPPITIRLNRLMMSDEATRVDADRTSVSSEEVVSSSSQLRNVRPRTSSEIKKALLKTERTRLSKRPLRHAYHLVDPPQLGAGSLFAGGYYSVQDESSQLIAHLVNPHSGEFIIDACAGPGGKLTHIHELMATGNTGPGLLRADHQGACGGSADASEAKEFFEAKQGTLWAFEKKTDAYHKMVSNLERIGADGVMCFQKNFLDYRPQMDGTPRPQKILLDAPCSALGVLRRHPEGKIFKKASIIPHMARKQRELLMHALEILDHGGELIYSVCSFEPEESLEHLEWLQSNHGDEIEVVSLKDRMPSYYRRYLTKHRMLWIYSGNADAMDGFGAFVIAKK